MRRIGSASSCLKACGVVSSAAALSLQFLGEFDQLGFGFLITGITGETPGVACHGTQTGRRLDRSWVLRGMERY